MKGLKGEGKGGRARGRGRKSRTGSRGSTQIQPLQCKMQAFPQRMQLLNCNDHI